MATVVGWRKLGMWRAALASALVGLAATPAAACFVAADLNLRDIIFADMVVIASLPSFEIVENERFRDREPGLHYLGDYVRLTLDVHEVLKGDAPDRLVVTWAVFEIDDEADPKGNGRDYLVALRAGPGPEGAMAQAISGADGGMSYITDFSGNDSALLTVLQAPCSPPFIFEAEDGVSQAIRQILDGEGDAVAEADAFADAFQM